MIFKNVNYISILIFSLFIHLCLIEDSGSYLLFEKLAVFGGSDN